MLNFTFHTPTIIHFGRGEMNKLAGELSGMASRILIVTGSGSVKKFGIFDEAVREIKKIGASYVELSGIKPNPRLSSVREGIEICRREDVDFILAIGGGSAVDAAKAIAAGVPYDGDVWDFFEKGVDPKDAVPLGVVLTLAATGSEMNTNSVITKEETKRKLAMSSPFVQPVFSILDPVYTFTVNPYHTAAGVADIMAHVFEFYFCPIPHTEVQDRISEALLKVCVESGPIACRKGDDYDARANILWTSTLALNGLVGKGRAADFTCHMIEHELSAVNDMSHGAGLAILLPAFMKVWAGKYGHEKLAAYGKNVFGSPDNAPEKTREFFSSIGLPSKLSDAGITRDMFPSIARNAVQARGVVDLYEQMSEKDIVQVLENCV